MVKVVKKIKEKSQDDLGWKIEESKKVLRLAYDKFNNKMAIFWTGGKDSTVLLHLVRDVFGKSIKFPIIYIDTQLDFEEVYKFIDKVVKDWKLDLIREKTTAEEMKKYYKLKTKKERVELASIYKIVVLKRIVKKNKLPALVIGIRWDEHPERISEKYVSPREDHIRIHPLLHWTEKDIWDYIRLYNVPYISLYDKGYRSLGEKEFTKPSKEGGGERSGRQKEREVIMKRLRALGYF
ncbi:phosphoadenosine phosphosulfate reductase family protein [Patescibacteria group bacterium]|nr:phosphoadenosine phosphosulfate reductase family protein [Patescibacteria group bacterium]